MLAFPWARDYWRGAEEPSVAASPPPTIVKAPVPAATTGSLTVESQPAGAKVSIDGEEVGTTPLKLERVAAGRHLVLVSTATTAVRRTVRIEAGKEHTLDIPAYSGWIALFSPIPVEVSERGRSLGTSGPTRIMLAPGRHRLTFSNSEFGYQETHTLDIVPGEELPVNLQPKGPVSINASPWAEVWIDGERAGDTPIAHLPVLLGTREFVFKHPTHGERKVTATVTASGAVVSLDFTK
jgi:hypothetical protein